LAQAAEEEQISLPLHAHQQFLVERFFDLITGRMIRRGTFHSTQELETVIWNGHPTSFVWKASAEVILDKVFRGHLEFRTVSFD
jgi:hypothetical protein